MRKGRWIKGNDNEENLAKLEKRDGQEEGLILKGKDN